MIAYDGRQFRGALDPPGTGAEAVYRQDGDLIWADFHGGQIRRGSLNGRSAPDGTIEFGYTMVRRDGEVISGRSVNRPELLADGRVRLHETWERYGPHAELGTSMLEEIPRDTGEPHRGGSVTMACLPDIVPVYIFPFTAPEYYGTANLHEFQALMYRPLYWYGSGGRAEVDFDLSLAEPPRWSEDGRTVTVELKPWNWSDGEPLNADNLIFWMHLLESDKERFGGYAPGYFPDNLTGYEKVDERTVAFTFDRAYSRRWVLMNQLSAIVPLPTAWDRTAEGPAGCVADKTKAHAVWEYLTAQNADRAGWADNPLWAVVNGPWRLDSCSFEGKSGEAVLVPNPHYSGPDKPYLDRFRLLATSSSEEACELLAAGPESYDGVQVGFLPFSAVTDPTDDPDKAGPNPYGPAYTLVPQTTFKINYFPVNFNNPTVAGAIIRQLYFRQALQSLVDQETAIAEVYKGYGYPTTGPIPLRPDSELISERQRETAYPFDIDRARRYLAENGWDVDTFPAVCADPGTGPGQAGADIPAGTPLSLELRYTTGYPGLAWMMAKLRDDAAKAGIELRLAEVEASAIIVEDSTGRPAWHLSNYNGGWIYGPGFHPTGEFLYQTGSNVNFGGYTDARTDELIAETVATDDLEVLHRYQDHVAAQAPVIYVPNFPVRLLEVAAGLRGVEPLNPYGLITPEKWHYAFD